MKPSDIHATLRALDRLQPEDSKELDPLLADDPALAAEIRATEDAIAAIWHASSPPCQAPDSSLESILTQIHHPKRRSRVFVFLAAGGWAAALLLFLFPPTTLVNTTTENSTSSKLRGHSDSLIPDRPLAVTAPKRNDQASDMARLRETIYELQEILLAKGSSPRIRELRPPGDPAHRLPEERSKALLTLLTSTLTEDIARQAETPTTLVIENGWLESVFAALPESGVIRHRTFPVEDFRDFALLRSPDGDFYHPASQLLWSRAPDGGGFLGKAAPPDLDLALFNSDPIEDIDPLVETEQLERTQPELSNPTGYLVYGEGGKDATVIIGGLGDFSSSPRYFGVPSSIVVSSDGGQNTTQLVANNYWMSESGSGFATFTMAADPSSSSSTTIYTTNPDGTLNPILTESP